MLARLARILRIYPALGTLAALFMGVCGNTAAAAGFIALPGITFSEATDNFRLLAASGTGSLDDPFVLVEEVFGDGEVVVGINVHAVNFGSRIKTMHAVGFALQKVVINRTDQAWNYYALELEFKSGRGSDYYDGLSFAQKAQANRPFRSDSFAVVEDLTEPRDVIRFTQGRVIPGQQARFAVSITPTGHQPNFFLVQHVRPPYAELDRPIQLAECAVSMGPEGKARCRR
jgi:hypothetical protein